MLKGKVAMVTGSGGERGFGRAIARRLATEGADLFLPCTEQPARFDPPLFTVL
jgi:NAD(P)-dependent dehydrogenase (short-subunit alcohol dehydrogenase family)